MDQQLKYRLLVSDIDGTLVSSDSRLEEETVQSIEEFRQAGGRFTLATGRNFSHTIDLIERLQLDTPVILSDGAVLYDPVNKNKQIISSFTWKQLDQIVRQCQEISSEIDVFVFGYHKQSLDYCLYGVTDHPIIRKYAAHWYFNYEIVSSFEEIAENAYIVSALVMIKDPSAIQPFQEWSEKQSKNFHAHLWMKEMAQLLPFTATKGTAIISICDKLNLSIDQVAAIGDQLNDLSMARTVGMFAAMENGDQRVKESAQLVVPKNDDLGVAHFIRHHLLPNDTKQDK